MEKKEEKKGFWVSLLTPKQRPCCATVIEEVQEEREKDEQKVTE